MKTPIGVAVIGCGGISSVHLSVLSGMPEVSLKAVCDIRPDRLAAATDRWHVDGYADYQDVLRRDDVQCVHLCTPHYLHAPMALDALAAGKYVLTEKPMATTIDGALKMIAADSGRLGVIFQNRYNPSVQMLRRLLDAGTYGAIKTLRALVCWHRDAPYYTQSGWRGAWATEGGGSLINQALHTVDLMQWFAGPILALKGSATTDLLQGVIEVEDNAHAVIRFESGVVGLLHTSNNYGIDAPIELEIVCERATLRLVGDTLIKLSESSLDVLCANDDKSPLGKAYWGASHERQIRDFYDCMLQNKRFWLDGREAYPALWIVKAVYASTQSRDWVPYEGV